jgi:hypothetical protein
MRKHGQLAGHAGGSDGSVDLLITGCEVSLWAGEQFAADLALVVPMQSVQPCSLSRLGSLLTHPAFEPARAQFPKLRVATCSANKLLGLFGSDFPIPAVGFAGTLPVTPLHSTLLGMT